MALAALEGGMGTLEVPVASPLPIAPDLVVPDVPTAPVELVEGLVVEPIGTRVSSVFLLQPPNARAAANASAIALADLSADACIYVSFDQLEWLNSSQLPIYLRLHHCLNETSAQGNVGIFRAAY